MDRVIVYPGSIPLETDLLKSNKNIMLALGQLIRSLLGTSTQFSGFGVGPTAVPSMAVAVAPGAVYQLGQADLTAYSTLPADATAVMKQGLTLDVSTLPLTAPTTPGYSMNYLIEVTMQDVDTSSVVLPYYNASNPQQAFAGPSNTGAAQATVRSCRGIVTAIPGAPATSGSQVTPPATPGSAPIAYVTVNYADTAINSAAIHPYPNAPMVAGFAPLASPNFTGVPTVPTPPTINDSSPRVPNTAWVQQIAAFLSAQIDAVAHQVPSGVINAFPGTAAPAGWAICNGAAVSRAANPNLWSALGTTYGVGDGSTTFNLPDLRGEFIRGLDNGRGVDVGRTIGSHQDYATAAPKNTEPERLLENSTTSALTNASNPSVVGFARVSKTGESVTDKYFDAGAAGSEMDGMNVMTGDAETRPRNVALNYIIKLG